MYEKLKEEHRVTVYLSNGTKIENLKLDKADLINVDFVPQSEKENLKLEVIPYQLPKQGLLM